MSQALLIALGVAITLYAAAILALILAGRGAQASALARFIPDCLILLKRLLGDPRLPRRRKAPLILLVAYLLSPIDLVPDFIPIVGQLDDVLVAGLALRIALRGAPPGLIEELWPGPPESLEAVRRLAAGRLRERVRS